MKKILLAYNGSDGAEAALTALSRFGYADSVQVCVLNVADVWVPPNGDLELGTAIPMPPEIQHARKRVLEVIQAKGKLAQRAAEKLRQEHSAWSVEAVVSAGPPANVIVAMARDWEADLIVLGSQARHWLEQLLFRSISRRVMNTAPCTVQVVRPRQPAQPVSAWMRLFADPFIRSHPGVPTAA